MPPRNVEQYCGIDVRRIPVDGDGYLCLHDPRGDSHVLIGNITSDPQSPIVLSTAARLPGGEYTGHKAAPQDLLIGRRAQVLMIPANATFTNVDITKLVAHAKMIAVFGGSHPGPNMMGRAAPTYKVMEDGGYDSERDRIEFQMLQNAIALEKPLFGVCRGFHVGVAMLLANIEGIEHPEDMYRLGQIFTPAEPHHRAHPGKPVLTHPLMQTLPEDMKHLCPWIWDYSPVSYHNLKITYGYLQTVCQCTGLSYEQELRNRGWYVAAVDGTNDVPVEDKAIEMLVRVDENGDIDSYLIQSHPEKPAPTPLQQPNWYEQQYWSQEVAGHAVQSRH